MSDDFIYYKDLDDRDIDLKLELAKNFYNRVDDSCKYIEGKAQQVLTAALAILTLAATFYTALIRQSINLPKLFTTSPRLFWLMIIITLTICLAGYFASETFNTNTVYYIGKNDILNLRDNKKKQLLEKYLNYAKANLSIQQQKQSYFEKSLLALKCCILFLFIYITTNIICNSYSYVFSVLAMLKSFGVVFLFIILFIAIIIIIWKWKNLSFVSLKDKKEIEETAYYKHLKYPQNSDIENWLSAYEEYYMKKNIFNRQGIMYKLKKRIFDVLTQKSSKY